MGNLQRQAIIVLLQLLPWETAVDILVTLGVRYQIARNGREYYGITEDKVPFDQLLLTIDNDVVTSATWGTAPQLKSKIEILNEVKTILEEVISWYGQGYDVANYHYNGDLESLDNFIENIGLSTDTVASLQKVIDSLPS